MRLELLHLDSDPLDLRKTRIVDLSGRRRGLEMIERRDAGLFYARQNSVVVQAYLWHAMTVVGQCEAASKLQEFLGNGSARTRKQALIWWNTWQISTCGYASVMPFRRLLELSSKTPPYCATNDRFL